MRRYSQLGLLAVLLPIALGGVLLGLGLSQAFPLGADALETLSSPFVLLVLLCLFLSLLTAALLLGWSSFGLDREDRLAPYSGRMADEMAGLIRGLDAAAQAAAEIQRARSTPGLDTSPGWDHLREACTNCRGAGVVIHAWVRPLDSEAADTVMRAALLPGHILEGLHRGSVQDTVALERLLQSIASRLSDLVRCLAYEEPHDDVLTGLRHRCGQVIEILSSVR